MRHRIAQCAVARVLQMLTPAVTQMQAELHPAVKLEILSGCEDACTPIPLEMDRPPGHAYNGLVQV